MSYGFRFVITDEELPTGRAAMPYSVGEDLGVLVHRPSLLDDPEGVLEMLGPMLDACSREYVRIGDLRAVS